MKRKLLRNHPPPHSEEAVSLVLPALGLAAAELAGNSTLMDNKFALGHEGRMTGVNSSNK